MNNNNKQLIALIDAFDDQQLPKQWEPLTNRLTLVEENLIKLNRKVAKLQKNLSLSSQNQKDLQKQFKQKLSQMVQILTDLPSDTNKFQFVSEQLDQMKVQIVEIKQFKNWCVQQMKKASEFSNYQLNFSHIQSELKVQILSLEQKISYFVDSKIKQMGFVIKQLKQSQDSLKATINTMNVRSQQNSNNTLNTSMQSKYSSQSKFSNNQLSHSKSSNKVFSTTNIFENYQPTHEICLSPKQYQSNGNNMPSASSRYNGNQYNISSNKPPSNNSRAVYLKQKLKQFEQINKKYQVKQGQTPKKTQFNQQKVVLSHKNKEIIAHDYNTQKMQYKQKYKQHQKGQILKSKQKESRTIQPNVQKRLEAIRLSMQKTSSVNKLKNIKNYLQQTESEIDQSNIMEPYYK